VTLLWAGEGVGLWTRGCDPLAYCALDRPVKRHEHRPGGKYVHGLLAYSSASHQAVRGSGLSSCKKRPLLVRRDIYALAKAYSSLYNYI